MPFTLAYHQAIDKAKIESQLMATFHEEIKSLQALGFDELYFVREIMFPFSGIFTPLVWLEAKKRRDLWRVGRLFQIIFFNPLLYNREYDTYGHIMDLGLTLLTRFQDGTALISANYESKRRHTPEVKIHFHANPGLSIELAWEKHQNLIAEMEAQGYRTDEDMSLEKYTVIIQESDRLSIFGKEEETRLRE